MNSNYESYFDARIRKVGNSRVVTIPNETIEKLSLEESFILEVAIRKYKKRGKK